MNWKSPGQSLLPLNDLLGGTRLRRETERSGRSGVFDVKAKHRKRNMTVYGNPVSLKLTIEKPMTEKDLQQGP